MYCTACGAAVPEGGRFCGACGRPASGSASAPVAAPPGDASSDFDAPTELAPDSGLPPASSAPPSAAASRSSDDARFLPGTLIDGRYRVAGLLGRGGMGEVYRADDLKLGQSVALKFLPEAAGRDPDWLERFLNEVKIARRVSHPNVCRVYDVGEVGGHHYLSMEYIDGEDLASLLRRIGHLPQDKAVQIARQICAGLAASHDQGVLHRDLKPANVMIDGRGNAHITDFGLAGLAATIRKEDVASGTPAYMAPEQLAGREVTEASDLYSLGLVLYQLFTGRSAYEASSVEELSRLQQESAPARPRELVQGLDDTVEAVILRCLAPDPADRPPSALAVSAALPGGDPLAAALAAGDTPSPEMVAAAGEKGSLEPRKAWALLAGLLVLVAILAALGSYQVTAVAPLDKPRDVLIDRARGLLDELGVDLEAATDTAFGFSFDADYQRYLERLPPDQDRWELVRRGRPPVLRFWYRVSPRPLLAFDTVAGRVFWGRPAWELAGMAGVRLDTQGRLVELRREPRQRSPSANSAATADWDALFAAAGLDRETFVATTSEWAPPHYADERAAWSGELPELPGVEVRLEAAAVDGSPVYFRLVGPWSRAERESRFEATTLNRANQVIGFALFASALIVGLWLMIRNLRTGRGDRAGALKLALATFLVNLVAWVFISQHASSPSDELNLLLDTAADCAFQALLIWMLYIALEPYVRRNYPEWLIAWNRLLGGGVRDPLVGRDILYGAICGAAMGVLVLGYSPIVQYFGRGTDLPQGAWTEPLMGFRWSLGVLGFQIPNAIQSSLLLIFFWFLFRKVLRKPWLATAAIMLVLGLSFIGASSLSLLGIVVALALATVFTFVLVRLGLLALASLVVFGVCFANLPMSLSPSVWYARGSWLVIALLVGVALWAFRVAIGGQRLFSVDDGF